MKSNFVLWRDLKGRAYYVTKRSGKKSESSSCVHFVAFYESASSAYAEAERRTQLDVIDARMELKRIQRCKRIAKRKEMRGEK